MGRIREWWRWIVGAVLALAALVLGLRARDRRSRRDRAVESDARELRARTVRDRERRDRDSAARELADAAEHRHAAAVRAAEAARRDAERERIKARAALEDLTGDELREASDAVARLYRAGGRGR